MLLRFMRVQVVECSLAGDRNQSTETMVDYSLEDLTSAEFFEAGSSGFSLLGGPWHKGDDLFMDIDIRVRGTISKAEFDISINTVRNRCFSMRVLLVNYASRWKTWTKVCTRSNGALFHWTELSLPTLRAFRHFLFCRLRICLQRFMQPLRQQGLRSIGMHRLRTVLIEMSNSALDIVLGFGCLCP